MSTYLRSDFKEAIASSAIGFVVLVLILICVLVSRMAHAKAVFYGTVTEQVRIKNGGATIFRFSKAVQTITGASHLQIKPANDADPSYTVLSVTPRFTNGSNDVVFFLADGSVVRTKIIVSPNDPSADGIYDFKSKDAVEAREDQNAPTISEVELLKAMVRDDEVSGYKVNRVSDSVSSRQSGVEVELIRIYRGSPFNGYVFRIANLNWKKTIDVDVRHITVGEPNMAILSQSDEEVLYPKNKGVHQTLVRVVAKSTSSSRDVILAMEAQESEAASGSTAKKGE